MADAPQRTASPVCFLHELEPDAAGGFAAVDPEQRRDVARWRRAERERLIAARLALDPATRAALTARLAGHLDALLGSLHGVVVSAWLPFRGEPDLRPWMAAAAARGAVTALPVVEARGRPLRFCTWRPGEALAPGPWGIPMPAGGEAVVPDLMLAPVVGFDGEGFRLGYGGGFFDRTLAALAPRPRAVGVGLAAARLATIFPQPHDVPMDMIVTEAGCAVRRSP
ncbi:5-formyltetrahydrofolate cyclo-ligase [Roseicella aquatilis]|uniref:5-formyltetrahydrofolate cyclo-ligase n=1 Tax=Roseicella aquatilis TaxID=2527868 RepID=A0A4R4D6C7_9PROT|nr:5-formyltetrahydrofolate cyclo-ligase [Roseicella aquatilis]TCZ54596.1 5-formyltetrahydrofolate cyclo-ligase [Roseicella aquatilis]